MTLQECLLKTVDKFHITTWNGVKFWAPYIRNENYSQDPSIPRGLGKASPEEIKKSADFITRLFPGSNAEQIRKKLIDGSLPEQALNYKGSDCSGFTYHVMSDVYKGFLNKELIDDLSLSKEHVLNGAYNFEEWKAAYELSEDEAVSLPHDVPMRWVVEKFHRKPQNLCQVAGLASDYSSVEVPTKMIRVGDLVIMNNHKGQIPHVAIVIDCSSNNVTLAHSGRKDPEDIGGVSIETISYDERTVHTEEMTVPRVYTSIRRLKSLC